MANGHGSARVGVGQKKLDVGSGCGYAGDCHDGGISGKILRTWEQAVCREKVHCLFFDFFCNETAVFRIYNVKKA